MSNFYFKGLFCCMETARPSWAGSEGGGAGGGGVDPGPLPMAQPQRHIGPHPTLLHRWPELLPHLRSTLHSRGQALGHCEQWVEGVRATMPQISSIQQGSTPPPSPREDRVAWEAQGRGFWGPGKVHSGNVDHMTIHQNEHELFMYFLACVIAH